MSTLMMIAQVTLYLASLSMGLAVLASLLGYGPADVEVVTSEERHIVWLATQVVRPNLMAFCCATVAVLAVSSEVIAPQAIIQVEGSRAPYRGPWS